MNRRPPSLPKPAPRIDLKQWRRDNLTRWERVKTALGFRTRVPEGVHWRG